MRKEIRALLLHTPLYRPLRILVDRYRDWAAMRAWRRAGCLIPPPHSVKQAVLREHSRRFHLRVLVETGTCNGDMVLAMIYAFRRIYSIELSAELFALARERVAAHPHVELLQGDSAKLIGAVLARLTEPSLFWLDGHYSGGVTARGVKETPINDELDQIFNAPDHGHVIVIDDARCFGSSCAYPTIEELHDLVRERRPNSRFEVSGDSIRITPG
jgi:hypothetical protein